jgi:predicted Zn-dependent protease with MMP-like domain
MVVYNGLVEREKFETLVYKAIDALPEEFKSKLENVDVLVEDWPSQRQINQFRLRSKAQLLGLYEGVPQTQRGSGYNLVPPDKITIFQRPIEMECRADREIEAEIGRVVKHEIAHHFGIGDARLYEIERQKRNKRDYGDE